MLFRLRGLDLLKVGVDLGSPSGVIKAPIILRKLRSLSRVLIDRHGFVDLTVLGGSHVAGQQTLLRNVLLGFIWVEVSQRVLGGNALRGDREKWSCTVIKDLTLSEQAVILLIKNLNILLDNR